MKCIDFTLKINKVHAALVCDLDPERFPLSKSMKHTLGISWIVCQECFFMCKSFFKNVLLKWSNSSNCVKLFAIDICFSTDLIETQYVSKW